MSPDNCLMSSSVLWPGSRWAMSASRVGSSRMRDGAIRRGNTRSYVVVSEISSRAGRGSAGVGGYPTQKAPKTARVAARSATNRGTWVVPHGLAVAVSLDRWIEAHAVELCSWGSPSSSNYRRDEHDDGAPS
jgi:hypothetical protein